MGDCVAYLWHKRIRLYFYQKTLPKQDKGPDTNGKRSLLRGMREEALLLKRRQTLVVT